MLDTRKVTEEKRRMWMQHKPIDKLTCQHKENTLIHHHTVSTHSINTPYLSLKKRRKPKAISLSTDSSTKVEVKK